MRNRLWLLAALALLTVGCVGSQETPVASTGGEQAQLPGPVYDEQQVEAGASAVGSVVDEPCQDESSSCYRYPFTTGTDTRAQIHLDWADTTNDFDLYILGADGDEVATSSTGPLDTGETLDVELEPGSYEIVVVPWLTTSETYTLEAHFGYA